MSKIKILTSQNIEIEYELATLFDRILAWLIDFMILAAAYLIISLIIFYFNPFASPFAYLAGSAPVLLYHLVCELFWDGKSVGKSALGIRVVRLDGSNPHFFNYVLRWSFRILETNPALLYGSFSILAISFTERSQRFGDLLSGTAVIRTARKDSLTDTVLMKAGEHYEPVFQEARQLTDRDANTIKEVIAHYSGGNDRAVMNACANRVAHVLNLLPPENMNAPQFLRTILRDYNQLNQ